MPRNRSQPRSVRTRSSSFQVLAAVLASLTLLLHFIASFQLESILDSKSILEARMSSQAGDVNPSRDFACMGCTAHGDGRSEPTFFNDYKSAAVHYSRSSHCNKSRQASFIKTLLASNKGTFRASGLAGIEPIPSKSE
jgi:hypothetical protein